VLRLVDAAHAARTQVVQDPVIPQNQAERLAGADPIGLILGEKFMPDQLGKELLGVVLLFQMILDARRQGFPIFGRNDRRLQQLRKQLAGRSQGDPPVMRCRRPRQCFKLGN